MLNVKKATMERLISKGKQIPAQMLSDRTLST